MAQSPVAGLAFLRTTYGLHSKAATVVVRG